MGCVRPIGPAPAIAEREEGRQRLERFSEAWLEPARIAPPTVSPEPQVVESEGVSARVRVLRAEEASWNEWGEGVRLFNERAGYFFAVELAGEGRLAWLPERTLLERNVEGSPLRASADPDEFLLPLQQAALHAAALVLDRDFGERARAAGPFRSAYLSRRAQRDRLDGVVGFRADDTSLHVVAMRLTLAVQTETGPRDLVIEWD